MLTLPTAGWLTTRAAWRGTPDQPQAPLELCFAGTRGLIDAIRQEQRLKQSPRSGYEILCAFQGALLQTLFLSNGVYQPAVFLQAQLQRSLRLVRCSPPGCPCRQPTCRRQREHNFRVTGFPNPYTQQADLSIERQLSRNMSLTLNYIWSRGIRSLLHVT